jgi:hypothetical protein
MRRSDMLEPAVHPGEQHMTIGAKTSNVIKAFVRTTVSVVGITLILA